MAKPELKKGRPRVMQMIDPATLAPWATAGFSTGAGFLIDGWDE